MGRAPSHSLTPRGTRVGKQRGAGEGEHSPGSVERVVCVSDQEKSHFTSPRLCRVPALSVGGRQSRQPLGLPKEKGPVPTTHHPKDPDTGPTAPYWKSRPRSAASWTACPFRKVQGTGKRCHLFWVLWRPGAQRKPAINERTCWHIWFPGHGPSTTPWPAWQSQPQAL